MRVHRISFATILLGLLAMGSVRPRGRPTDRRYRAQVEGKPRRQARPPVHLHDPAFLFPPIGSADDPATGTPGERSSSSSGAIRQFALYVPPGAGNPGWSARPAAHPSYRFRNETIHAVTLRQSKFFKSSCATWDSRSRPRKGRSVFASPPGRCETAPSSTPRRSSRTARNLPRQACARREPRDCSDASLGLPPPPGCGASGPGSALERARETACAPPATAGACASHRAHPVARLPLPAWASAGRGGVRQYRAGRAAELRLHPRRQHSLWAARGTSVRWECSSGQVCRPVYEPQPLGGSLGCNCGNPGACGPGTLDCPNGFACAVTLPDTYFCKPINCSGGSGYPTCDGTCGPGACQA